MKLKELARAGEWNEALAFFQDWLDEAHSSDLLLARAVCRAALGDISAALVDVCAALEEDKPQPDDELANQLAVDAPQAAQALLEAAESCLDGMALSRLRGRLRVPERTDSVPSNLALPERRARVEEECARLLEAGDWVRAESIAEEFLGEVRFIAPGGEVDATELQAIRESIEAQVTQLLSRHALTLLDQGATATATLIAKRAVATLGPYHRGEQILDVRLVAAQAAIALGEPQEALDDLSDAERYVRNRMQRARVGELLADVGDLAHLQKRLDVAASAYDRAASLFERAKNKDGSSPVLASALRAAARKLRG